jgi:hypothetical protein
MIPQKSHENIIMTREKSKKNSVLIIALSAGNVWKSALRKYPYRNYWKKRITFFIKKIRSYYSMVLYYLNPSIGAFVQSTGYGVSWYF